MASLFDLVQQYLKRDNLPKPFTYDRTPPIGTNPPGLFPQPPVKPIEKLLPRPGGNEDGFSVYNPDPNRTRTSDQYSPYNYRQAAERNLIGTPGGSLTGTNIPNTSTEVAKLMDMYPDYYQGKQLTGIPGAAQNYLKNSFIGKGLDALGNMMPVNRRAIYENELLGQGIAIDDIGRIVSGGGDYDTAENVMSGYNANKVTAETFQKRRDRIKKTMSKPGYKGNLQERLDALDAAEEKMLGTAKTRADMVFDDKSLAKDPDFISEKEITKNNNIINLEKEEDEDGEVSYYDPVKNQINSMPSFTGFNAPSTFTLTAPQYGASFGQGYGSGYGNNSIITGGTDLNDFDGIGTTETFDGTPDYYGGVGDSVIDAGGTAPGGGYTSDYYGGVGDSVIDAGGTAPGGGYTTDYYGGGGDPYSYDNFMAGDNSSADPTGTGNFSDQVTGNDTSPGATGGEGGAGTGGSTKIVCTMMNESYGFGSFRNKIWLKHSKGLAPEYQKGYHKLFLPLVKIAKTNKVVRKILEHIAVHRTIDIRQESRGKVHLLGRVYRKILEPICYFVGKHG